MAGTRFTRQGSDALTPDGRPDYLAKEVEKSLRLLNTDVIDLWQLHRTIPGSSSQEVVAEAALARPDVKVILTSAYAEEVAMR